MAGSGRVAGAVAGVLVVAALAGCSQDDPSGGGGATASAASTPAASATSGPAASGPRNLERDPAVRALRIQYLGSALGVNNGHLDNAQLRDSSTARRLGEVARLFSSEVGHGQYPGPIPFTPLSVTRVSASERTVPLCVVGDGWLLKTGTTTPTLPRKVYGGVATVVLSKGRWRVSEIVQQDSVKCGGVAIREVHFRT